ncbi:PucR family transcriptional regulator [Microbacterium sp. MPKO10]|uniref:PucR family transcriptional regulator n=1 Tax=Microbacterium sp. MPKO10 TaxID=2989818 RepID=UPI0022368FE1|nr:PucR family transcriptional regulator [Microbacterium sp. MPKO10]MCW4456917.1 PucR family transcriptional regulator [Microbacterium sp. MPKO10]
MAITVHRLLARTDLGLRLLSRLPEPTASELHPLDQPLTWVASTDLEDPTPFLTAGNIVLTTGRQFADDPGEEAARYVQRLARFGIRAIGFGTDVIRGVPAELIAACERERMPLIDVPYSTPFIAVVRYIADLVTAQEQGRSAWAADAQRTISLAALRDDGLRASIGELARLLERPVALFDARGDLLHATSRPLHVSTDARRLLDRGIPAAITTDEGVMLQTIGRGSQLRGVLAIPGPLDHPAQGVVSGVVALAAMALEQRRSLAEASLALRTGAWQCLRVGNVDLARRLADGALPSDRVIVGILTRVQSPESDFRHNLDVGPTPQPHSLDDILADPMLDGLFTAWDDTRIALVLPSTGPGALATPGAPEAHAFAEHNGIRLGLSSATALTEMRQGVIEAELALARAPRQVGVTRFDEVTDAGFDAVLDNDATRALAQAMLRPVTEYDATHGTALVPALRAWLEHNGAWHPAASRLGIHRHTLRKQIQKVEQLTGRDLSQARARAELTLASDSIHLRN